MSNSQPNATNDEIRAAYAAIVDYHNNLFPMRFTVAGLVLAANGFLVSVFSQSNLSLSLRVAIPILGILVSFICWMLEVRTYQLLENLSARGERLEKSLGLKDDQGFFSLMSHQPIGPRILPLYRRWPSNRIVQFLVSHSFGINILYIIIGLFWLIAFILFLVVV